MKKYLFLTKAGEAEVVVKDNKVKDTLVFLHGFAATWETSKGLFELENNYNIVAISFPRKNVTFQTYIDTLDELNKKVLLGPDNAYLGHSFGGAVAITHGYSKHIKDIVLIAPFNPSVVENPVFGILHDAWRAEEGVKAHELGKIGPALKGALDDKALAAELVDPDSEFADVTINNITNRDWMSTELKKLFVTTAAKLMIGSDDPVIPTVPFQRFVQDDLRGEMIIVPNSGHVPTMDNPEFVNDQLNKRYPKRKRGPLSRFISTKALKPNN